MTEIIYIREKPCPWRIIACGCSILHSTVLYADLFCINFITRFVVYYKACLEARSPFIVSFGGVFELNVCVCRGGG